MAAHHVFGVSGVSAQGSSFSLPFFSSALSPPDSSPHKANCSPTACAHTKPALSEEHGAVSKKRWSPDFLQESEASLAEERQSQDYGEKWEAGLLERAGIGDTGFLVDF